MTTKVLTPEEIELLKSIQTKQNDLIQNLGIVEYKMQLLELDKQALKVEIQKQIDSESNLGKQLQEKYGDGTIDLEKGEFISSN